MTTYSNAHAQNDIPKTPQAEYSQDQVFNSSPISSPKMTSSSNLPTSEVNDNKVYQQKVSKEKRKYSNSLFKWTQELWEVARKDIERRSSVSSNESNDSSSTDDEKSMIEQER
ncbi:uncharacterized protein L201_002381 [Kwoniella dendrophila CBS 6074]|uniref:Uncharacterized protein n=1 Tax=Kwoniella dendrophila CBS 6074 TaxID=1295534 RepID=A0AAX4JQ20_9TREE